MVCRLDRVDIFMEMCRQAVLNSTDNFVTLCIAIGAVLSGEKIFHFADWKED